MHIVKSKLCPNPGYVAPEPNNNDGRDKCFWCSSPTKKSQGFNKMYDICINCGK